MARSRSADAGRRIAGRRIARRGVTTRRAKQRRCHEQSRGESGMMVREHGASPWDVLCELISEKTPGTVSRTRRVPSAHHALVLRCGEIRIGDQEPELAAAILRVRDFSGTFDQQLAFTLRRDLNADRLDAARNEISLGRL